MQFTRRTFAQAALKGVATLGVIGVAAGNLACPTAGNVYDNIIKYAPTALSAFAAILALLAGAGVPIGPEVLITVAAVKLGMADLQTVIAQYQAAPSYEKTTLVGKIAEALNAVEESLQKFWSDLKIPDPKLTDTVQGLLGILVSTLMGFSTQLPPVAASAARMALKKSLSVPAKKRSLSQFKAEFNALMKQKGFTQTI
jgi:hypothetical protein